MPNGLIEQNAILLMIHRVSVQLSDHWDRMTILTMIHYASVLSFEKMTFSPKHHEGPTCDLYQAIFMSLSFFSFKR